jgi:hypothetical protein
MMPEPYDSNLRIFQTADYVAIQLELIHETRIIPLDRRAHIGPNLRQWMGDPRGHWEGDTLVIDSTNFNDKLDGGTYLPARMGQFQHLSVHRGAGDTLHLVERLTRIDADTIQYEFTMDDPKTFTRRWTASNLMRRTDNGIFEYACHEGNYGLAHILSGARAKEEADVVAGAKTSAK